MKSEKGLLWTYVTVDLIQKVRSLADTLGISISEYIRHLIMDDLKMQEVDAS